MKNEEEDNKEDLLHTVWPLLINTIVYRMLTIIIMPNIINNREK